MSNNTKPRGPARPRGIANPEIFREANIQMFYKIEKGMTVRGAAKAVLQEIEVPGASDYAKIRKLYDLYKKDLPEITVEARRRAAEAQVSSTSRGALFQAQAIHAQAALSLIRSPGFRECVSLIRSPGFREDAKAVQHFLRSPEGRQAVRQAKKLLDR